MYPRWAFVVRCVDRSGIWRETRFIGENSARNYAEDMLRAGFYHVSIKPVRTKPTQRSYPKHVMDSGLLRFN